MLKRKMLSVLILCLVPFTLHAGDHGPGGSPIGSTEKEVESALNFGFATSWTFAEISEELKATSAPEITDPEVKKILGEVFALPEIQEMELIRHRSTRTHDGGAVTSSLPPFKTQAELDYIQNNRFEIKPTKGYCYDTFTGKPSVAALLPGRAPIQICLSIPLLRRYPVVVLDEEIAGLIFHELVHAAGYIKTDREAKLVQRYIFKNLFKQCGIYIYVTNTIKGGSDDPRFVLNVRKASYPSAITNEVMNVEYENIFKNFVNGMFDGMHLSLTNQNGSSDAGPDFSAQITMKHSEVQFKSYNLDGTISSQSISWGKLVPNSFAYFKNAEPISSTITFNGQKLGIDHVDVWSECFGK
jgi:hypothetical protein